MALRSLYFQMIWKPFLVTNVLCEKFRVFLPWSRISCFLSKTFQLHFFAFGFTNSFYLQPCRERKIFFETTIFENILCVFILKEFLTLKYLGRKALNVYYNLTNIIHIFFNIWYWFQICGFFRHLPWFGLSKSYSICVDRWAITCARKVLWE